MSTRRPNSQPFLTITPSTPDAAPIHLDDRAAITPGSGIDLLITVLEELAYRGYEGATPAALTITLDDNRAVTLTPGPAFLAPAASSPPTPRPVRIPVYIVTARPHPTLGHTLDFS